MDKHRRTSHNSGLGTTSEWISEEAQKAELKRIGIKDSLYTKLDLTLESSTSY